MRTRWILVAAAGLALALPALAQDRPALPAAPAPSAGLSPPPAEPLLPPPMVAPPTTDPLPFPGPDYAGDGTYAASRGRFWTSGEYLFAWLLGSALPPLVTTSPAGTPRAIAGVLGSPTTSTLFDGVANDSVRPGFRINSGYWFGPQRVFGVEAGFMMLGSQATNFGAGSTGTPILARPYFDATTGGPASVLVAFPGSSAGSIFIQDRSGNFMGANVDLAEVMFDNGWLRLVPLLGYRFFRFDDGLRMQQSIAPTGGAFVPGTVLASTDDFRTENEFHGGDFGMRTQFFWRNFSLTALTKVAVGQVHSDIYINGSQVVTVPGAAPIVQTGGVFALPSNIGHHGLTTWTFIPELGLNLGWQISRNWRLTAGYTLLFLDDIARAAGQMDMFINPALLPPATAGATPSRPIPILKQDDVWIQALSLGVQFTY